MFKKNNRLSVQLASENFQFVDNHHNFRHQSGKKFRVNHVNTKNHSNQSALYLETKILNSILQEIKKSYSF